jgi:multiple sugar transport system substrate-binding protein
MKNILARLAAVLLGALLLASGPLTACSSGNPSADSSAPVQLVYQDWRTDWFPPMAQQMLAGFQADHPGIQVFFVPDPEDYQARVLADFQAGTAPDIFQGCCTHFPSWAQMGYTLDLQHYVATNLDQSIIDDWDPAQYHAFFTDDGRQFGLPKYHGALALYYNKDLFDAYGVAYPDDTWTYDDYLEAMRLLTHDRNGDGATDLWGSMIDISWDRLQVHVNAWGGHFVDPNDATHSLMDQPEAMAAMEWVRARMWDDRVMASSLDVQNMTTREAFVSQQVAMVEDGSWALKDILTGADFHIGVAPMPRGPVRRATLTTTDGFGIYADTEHPDQAWEVMKFLISEDYGKAMARANFLQPARASLVDDWIGYIRDEFPDKASGMDLAAFADGQLNGYSVTTEIFANMADAESIARDAWEEVFTFGHAPLSALADAAAAIQAAQPGH